MHLANSLMLFAIFAVTARLSAYPVSLVKMSRNGATYVKCVSMVGDHHNRRIEDSPSGKIILKHFDAFLNSLHNEPITLIWEDGGQRCLRKPSHVYMLKKAQEFLQPSPTKRLHFVAADILRSSDPLLRNLVEGLVYHKEVTLAKFRDPGFRLHALSVIESSLSARRLRLHFKPLLARSQAPNAILSLLDEHIRLLEAKSDTIIKSLGSYEALLADKEQFHSELIRFLVNSISDVELLINIFASKDPDIVVYVGSGHLERLIKHLELLDFRIAYSNKNPKGLRRIDFQTFRKV